MYSRPQHVWRESLLPCWGCGGAGKLSFAFGALPVEVLKSWGIWISFWPLQERSCREGMERLEYGNKGYLPLNGVSQDKEWTPSVSMRILLLLSVSRVEGWLTGDGRAAAPSSPEVAVQRAPGRWWRGTVRRSTGRVLWELGSWLWH